MIRKYKIIWAYWIRYDLLRPILTIQSQTERSNPHKRRTSPWLSCDLRLWKSL